MCVFGACSLLKIKNVRRDLARDGFSSSPSCDVLYKIALHLVTSYKYNNHARP